MHATILALQHVTSRRSCEFYGKTSCSVTLTLLLNAFSTCVVCSPGSIFSAAGQAWSVNKWEGVISSTSLYINKCPSCLTVEEEAYAQVSNNADLLYFKLISGCFEGFAWLKTISVHVS